MGIRRTLMRAAGAFLTTTVLFAAAMVIAHGLIIPDPVRRVIPMTGQGEAEAASERATENVAVATDSDPRPPETTDASDPVPEITAVPVPDDDTDDDPVALTDGGDAPDDGDRTPASNRDVRSDDEGATREAARTEPQERADGTDDGGKRRSQPETPPQRPAGQTSSRVVEPPADQGDDDDDDGRTRRPAPRDDDDDDRGDWWGSSRDDDDDGRFRRGYSRDDDDDDRRSASSLLDFLRRAGDTWSSGRDGFGQRDDDRGDRDDGWR